MNLDSLSTASWFTDRSFWADCSGILGFGLTIYTAWAVTRLAKTYALLNRVPTAATQLRHLASQLLEAATQGNRPETLRFLREMASAVETIERHLHKKHWESCQALLQKLRNSLSLASFDDTVRTELEDLYAQAVGLAAKAESLVEDRKNLQRP